MATSKIALRAAARDAEAAVRRFRGVECGEEERGKEDDGRPDLTSLLAKAHVAATLLEDDLGVLRERLAPVLDPVGENSDKGGDDGTSAPPAIAGLEHLLQRLADISAAIRFLTRNARI